MWRVSEAIGSFAATLRHAVQARGLGLERLREHLDARGVSISVATLSYWQSGRSEPSLRSAQAVLPHLEEVLGLEPGGLREALPTTRERSRRQQAHGLSELWPDPPQSQVLRRLDTGWDTELDRIILHDVVRIGADRRLQSLTVRQVLKARVDGPDRRVVLHCQDDADAPPARFVSAHGCSFGRIEVSTDQRVTGAELLLHTPLRRGETAIVEYTLEFPSPGPLESSYERRLRLPIRELLVEVQFDPAAMPLSCRAVSECSHPPVSVNAEGRTHLALLDAPAGTHGIAWAWGDSAASGS